MNEDFLITGLREHNQQVFDYVFHEYYSSLCYYASQFIENHKDIEDLVQELFVTIWEKGEQLYIDSSLRAYLFVAVKHRCISHLRKQKSAEKYEDYLKSVLETNHNAVEQQYTERELREMIDQAVENLSPKCAEVFRLSREQGFSNQEIADQLSMSKRTVETHISNALRSLRAELQENWAVSLLVLAKFLT